jgi:hypothetical protein
MNKDAFNRAAANGLDHKTAAHHAVWSFIRTLLMTPTLILLSLWSLSVRTLASRALASWTLASFVLSAFLCAQ